MNGSRVVIALMLPLILVSGLAAQVAVTLDSSAYVSDTTSFSGELSEALGLAGTLKLGDKAKFTVKLEAAATLSFGEAGTALELPSVSGSSPYLAAIDVQEFSYAFGSPIANEGLANLSLSFGRLPYADPSGTLYSYRLDGLILGASYQLLSLRAVLGYTGFMPADAPILLGTSDEAYGNQGFAPPRLVAGFSLRPRRIFGQDFYFAFLAQEDLRHSSHLVPEHEVDYDTVQGGPMDSAYALAGFSGSVASLNYSGFGAYQFGQRLSYLEDASSDTGYRYRFAPVQALALGASLRYSLNPRLGFGLRFLFGSGDADATEAGNAAGDATAFEPISETVSGLAFSPNLGNLSLLEFTTRLSPFGAAPLGLGSLQVVSKTFLFAKNGPGPISEPGVPAASSAGLLGIEQDLSASLQLLSDVSLSVSAGVFLPFSGSLGVFDASYVEASPLSYLLRAGLSLAL